MGAMPFALVGVVDGLGLLGPAGALTDGVWLPLHFSCRKKGNSHNRDL